MKQVTLSVLLFAALGSGLEWEFEQVDAAGWGAGVQMRWHPDGRLFMCYGGNGGRVRLAFKDSIWRYEDVPTESLPQPGSQTFDIGPGGDLGVLYLHDGQPRYTCREDSGWAEVAGCSLGAGERAVLAFESDGAPSYAQGFYTPHEEQLGLAHVVLDGTVWRADTIDYDFLGTADCIDYRVLPDGRKFVVERLRCEPWLGDDIGFWRSDGGGWWYTYVAGYGGATRLRAVSGAADVSDVVRLCWADLRLFPPPSPAFYYDGEVVDSVQLPDLSALVIDGLRRPMIAYAGPLGVRFWYSSGGGRYVDDVAPGSIVSLDASLGGDNRPVIAYAVSGGVWLVRGSELVGVGENQQPQAVSHKLQATILSGASGVRRLASSVVFDAMGRRVLNPRSGVYFLREASGMERQASSVRKVIIQK